MIILLGAMYLMGALPASACDLQFSRSDQTFSLSPSASQLDEPLRETVSVVIRNRSDQECVFKLGFGRDATATDRDFPTTRVFGPAGEIRVQYVSSASYAGGAGYMLSQTIPANSDLRIAFNFAIDLDWGTRSGSYNQRFLLSLIDEATTTQTALTEINLLLDVPPAIRLRFVGNNDRLDLGALSDETTTVSPPFGLRIFSTSPYEVAVSSENQGALVQQNGRARIPYFMKLAGRQLDLAVAADILTFANSPGRLGRVLPIIVLVPPAKNRLAGRYSDTVTVTVSTI
ncbi:MAG: hypothetical protein WA989_14105 [Henriciella sp.]|uniref:hypothetical protein n=1 Tax=Henriciella sp. TaxID=1968823 RepID=UPI003C71DA89